MAIVWNPTPAQEVEQNVQTLLRTAPGTVPLARMLGTPQDLLDTPQSAAGARVVADVTAAVRAYEPRVKVRRVRLTPDAAGVLRAVVEITSS